MHLLQAVQVGSDGDNLQIPELIVLAVLPDGGKRAADIKAFTGASLDTSKMSARDRNIRVVALTVGGDTTLLIAS